MSKEPIYGPGDNDYGRYKPFEAADLTPEQLQKIKEIIEAPKMPPPVVRELRTKSRMVQGRQWDGDPGTALGIYDWSQSRVARHMPMNTLIIYTFHKQYTANIGDWIIKDGDQWFVVSKDEFNKLYEIAG